MDKVVLQGTGNDMNVISDRLNHLVEVISGLVVKRVMS